MVRCVNCKKTISDNQYTDVLTYHRWVGTSSDDAVEEILKFSIPICFECDKNYSESSNSVFVKINIVFALITFLTLIWDGYQNGDFANAFWKSLFWIMVIFVVLIFPLGLILVSSFSTFENNFPKYAYFDEFPYKDLPVFQYLNENHFCQVRGENISEVVNGIVSLKDVEKELVDRYHCKLKKDKI